MNWSAIRYGAVLLLISISAGGHGQAPAEGQRPGGLQVSLRVVAGVAAQLPPLRPMAGGVAPRLVRAAAAEQPSLAVEGFVRGSQPRAKLECASTDELQPSPWREEMQQQPAATLCTMTVLPD